MTDEVPTWAQDTPAWAADAQPNAQGELGGGAPRGNAIISAGKTLLGLNSPPPQAQAPDPSTWQGQLRALDQKYTGGIGRQAALAARAPLDAIGGALSMPWDATMAFKDAAFNDNKFDPNTPYLSPWIHRQLSYAFPEPENRLEQVGHNVQTMLAGSKLPIPGTQQPPGVPGITVGDTQAALKAIEKRLNQDNSNFTAASGQVQGANAQDVPMRLTDVGPNIRSTGEVLAQKPGAASNTLVSDRSAIMADTKTRVGGATREALNAQGDPGAFSDTLLQARSANAKANYEAVRNDSTPVMDPEIWKILENPVVANIYQRSKAMNAQVRSLDATMGKTTPPVADIYAPSTSVMPRPGAQGESLLPPPEGEPQWVRTGTVPDVRSLDWLQRAMDTEVGRLYSAARNGVSKGGEGDMATALKSARQELVSRLQQVSPSFKTAKSTYGDDSEIIEANQIGKSGGKDSFFSMSPQQAQQYVSGLSDSGKASLRMGVADRLLSQSELSGRNTNLASDILGGPRKQEIIKTLFDGDPSKYDAFMQSMQMESNLFKNNSQILGGSQTYRRIQAGEDFTNGIPETIGKVATIGSQIAHSWMGSATHGIIRLISGKSWNQGVANQAAKILSSGDPAQAAQALQQMERQLGQASRMRQGATSLVKGATTNLPQNLNALGQKYGVNDGQQTGQP